MILSFCDRQASVVFGIRLVLRAIVRDALDYDFGIVATGQGALRVRPIVFGLALVVGWQRPLPLLVVPKVSRRFGRVFVNGEVAESVDRIAFLTRLDKELLGKFVVGESREAQHPGRIGCR